MNCALLQNKNIHELYTLFPILYSSPVNKENVELIIKKP